MEARHKTKERAKQALKEHEISQQSSSSDDSDIEEVAPKIVDPEPQQKSVYFTAESTAQRLIVIIDNACLEIGQTKRGYELFS